MTVFESKNRSKSLREESALERHVEFKATDADRRVAIGGVMVPDKVDLQGDFVRQEVIEQFSDDFMSLLQNGDGTPGVMHSVFPENHVQLAENRVLESDTTLGGKEFPAGTWIQGWKFTDDELWGLVEDGVLSGYSIGARNVEWSEPVDETPEDVERASDYPDDEPVWEILSGEVHEVSSVDIPAVPDAQMVQAKSDTKAILDHVEGKNEFLDVMQQRGADEDSAERLWHYLQRAIDEHGEGKSASFFQRLGKGAWDALTGDASNEKQSSSTKEFMGEPVEEVAGAIGGTLDAYLAEADDVIYDALSDDYPDELAEAAAGIAAAVMDEALDDAMEQITQELQDSEQSLQMTNDDNPEDPPEWAKSIQETTEENSKAIKELREELKKSSEDDDPWEDAPEWAVDLRDDVESNAERVDELAEQGGKSQQLEGEDDEGAKTKANLLGIPGGDN